MNIYRVLARSGMAILAAGVTISATAWAAGPHEDPIREFANRTVKNWISDPIIVEAIRSQNARTAGMSQSEIDALDQRWRAEVGSASRPLIDETLSNPLSSYLSRTKDEQRGLVTEIFVMDSRGLNVGQSDVTSDYWQCDEAKWQQTFQVGPDAMLIDEVELDESTQTFQSQLSMSIIDPANGRVIGAITIGINVETLL